MLTISISGSNGFVGSNLVDLFKSLGYQIIQISRDDLFNRKSLESIIDKSDIVINLAGANIISRWSEDYKKTLYYSRINPTKNIVSAINSSLKKPRLLISTSAVGIYDNKQTYSEDNAKFSNDFLSKLCQDWEEEAKKAQTRVVIFRFGIVLANNGGALSKMLLPFKLGLGGKIGTGKQAFSYVHIDDLKNAFSFAIENLALQDAYNLCATIPTTNECLTKALGKTLKKATILTVPEFILNIIFGEGAKVLTDGQAAIPKRLEDAGFEFKYKNIEDTIENLLGERK